MSIIDVSKWQGNIDWPTVKANGVSLAILRVQDGQKVYDEKIAQNIQGCQQNNIPFGVYGFFRARNAEQGRIEAELLVSRTRASGGGALFYVIDCETIAVTPTAIKAAIDYFISQGLKCGIYFAHHLYGEFGGDYGQHFTWIPRYGNKPKYACDLWQYTSHGTIPGIKGYVDLNQTMDKPLNFFLDRTQNSTPVPTPPPAQPQPSFPQWPHIFFYAKMDRHGRFVGNRVYYGAAKEQLRIWQRRMAERGWNIGIDDGVFGEKCYNCCRDFQAEKGLAVDSIVGQHTWDAAWTTKIT